MVNGFTKKNSAFCEKNIASLQLKKYKTKNPHYFHNEGFCKIGIDILSQVLDQVPSAQVGLTSLFGMGRGDPHRYRRHKGIIRFKDKSSRFKILNFEY